MAYIIKLLVPPIFKTVMLNVNDHVFTLRSMQIRKMDRSLVFYWECRKKCGVIFITTIINCEHVKDKYFIQTNEHPHFPELLIENGYERLMKKCLSVSCMEDHRSNSEERNTDANALYQTGLNLSYRLSSFSFIDFPPEFRNTLSGQQFYIKDIGRKDHRIVILSTVENLEYLSQSRYWLASGTSDLIPTNSDLRCLNSFKHIYTIHGDIKIRNNIICVPLVFCLMANPTIRAYKTMFSELKAYAFEHDINFAENTRLNIVTDLNVLAINALINIFPFATHSISFFYFSKNIYEKIQSEQLTTTYNNNVFFNLLCRHIPALAFLPVSKVVEGWSKLKPLFSNNSDEQSLLAYFEATFVSRISCLRLGMQTPERISPVFHPQSWSIAADVKVEFSRIVTAKSWHIRLHKKPVMCDLIAQLQHIQNETENTLKQVIEGTDLNTCKAKENSREKQIKELVYELIHDPHCNIMEIIKEIAYNIDF